MNLRTGTLATLAAAMLLPLGAIAADAPAPAKAQSEATAAKEKKVEKAPCESTATTRLRRSKGEDCVRDPGSRTWTKEELDNTGQMDTREALKRLDPRIQ